MGFWKSSSKFAGKLAERAMLIIGGLQWGDNANDAEKISNALVTYEGKRSLATEEKSETLKFTVIILVIAVIILIVSVCFKMMLETVKKNNTPPQHIALTTLRQGSRKINDASASQTDQV